MGIYAQRLFRYRPFPRPLFRIMLQRHGDRMPRQVDYYFSLSSPWAYIGHKAFRDVVATYDLKVNHKPVILVDLFSETGGLPLIKRHPVRQRYRMVELQRWRDR